MIWLLAAETAWIVGAALVWLARGWRAASERIATAAAYLGAACSIVSALHALRGNTESWPFSWPLPLGAFALRIDPLSAVFLLPIAVIGALGTSYAAPYRRLSSDHGDSPPAAPAAFLALIAAMALVVVSANTVLFLMAWEIVTIASWYLLTSHHRDNEAREAGVSYLVAGHLSGAALFLLFVFLSQFDKTWAVPFAPVLHAVGVPGGPILFALTLIGFGIKAAVAPFHVWLPDAHAAAPSHVSALLSGVLVTLGFYGLARFLPLVASPSVVWAMILMTLGALGACGGIVMALSQRDVKRILAYSTIENAGLVTLAIGAALLSTALGRPALASLAWTAAFLHLWNHAISKSLLFFSAGAIARRMGTRDLEQWGGLLRRLPLLGAPLLVGAAAILGLPGTHGFASEWLLFLGLFRASRELLGTARLAMLLGVVAVASTAGMAFVCFVRVMGIGLLGHARSRLAAEATAPKEPALAAVLVTLAGSSLALVPLLIPMLGLLAPAVNQLSPGSDPLLARSLAMPLPWLCLLPGVGLGAVFAIRMKLAPRRAARRLPTWSCGYASPSASMQYTATSLPEPITSVLQPALRTSVRWMPPRGLWPNSMSWAAQTPERALIEVYKPAFQRLAGLLGVLTRLQEGRVTTYLRYVAVALLLLLVWLFFPTGPVP